MSRVVNREMFEEILFSATAISVAEKLSNSKEHFQIFIYSARVTYRLP